MKPLPITKEVLLDWLDAVPDGAEIGILAEQEGQLDLVARFGTEEYVLLMSGFPSGSINPETNGH